MKAKGNWKTVRLGDVCRVIPGYAFKSKDWCDSGIPVIKIKNIQEDRTIDIGETDHVPESVFSERLRKFVLEDGDILLAMTGATAGKVGRLRSKKPMLLNQRVAKIQPVDADPDFIWAVTSSEKYQSKFFYLADGAAQPNMSGAQIEGVEINLPDLATQRKIAGILSAYDYLIENNLRRIKILEQMAQSLYREWFVHFRFPGHESAKFMDSELGKIPVGWKLTDLAAVCVKEKGIQTGPFGSQLHESDYSHEGVPVVMPKDLIGFRIRTDTIARIPEATADKLIRHRMKLGDIVYGRRGDIGRRAFIMPHQVGWFCGTGCLRIRPDPDAVNSWYLFNFLGQDNVASLIAGRAQGVTMPNLNTGILSSVPVTLPPISIQEQFAKLSFPFAQSREALQFQIQNLGLTRDLLLPRLALVGK